MSERSVCFEALTGLGEVPEPLLRQLLREHGLDPAELGVDTERVGPEVLWELRERLPSDFVDAVHRIHDLSDPTGYDQLLSAYGGPLFLADGAAYTAAGFAAHAYLHRPDVFARAHGRRFIEALRRFQEFPGRLLIEPRWTPEAIGRVQGRLSAFFDERGRSSLCRIRPWNETGSRHFMISHGRHARTDDAVREVDGRASEVTLSWRPQQHDLVVYDMRTGRLRISAPDAHITREYVRVFGELLYGDPEWFAHGTVVSLVPLVEERCAVLTPTPGLLEVRWSNSRSPPASTTRLTVTFKGGGRVQGARRHPPRPGRLGSVAQGQAPMRFRSDGRWRADRVAGDWRRGDGVVRRYLELRGILCGPPAVPAEDVA
jgi:hypothetical protein